MPYGYNTTAGTSVGTAAGYQDHCLSCPAGFYCLNATVTPYACGKGYYTKLGQSVCQVYIDHISFYSSHRLIYVHFCL